MSFSLFESVDGGVTFVGKATLAGRAVIGTCSTALDDWNGAWVLDESSTVTVDVGTGTLSSSTREAILANQSLNLAAIGVHGRWELVQFRTATLTAPGVYTLSGFLRGSRSTEWAATGHVVGESFVLLNSAIVRIKQDVRTLGSARQYKVVNTNALPTLSAVTPVTFVNTGASLRPPAPTNLRALADVSDNITLQWDRKTGSTGMSSGIEASTTHSQIVNALGAGTEQYVVNVYADDTFTLPAVRTMAATSPTTYSAADQTTDGLTPGAPLAFEVYEIGGTGVKGFPARAVSSDAVPLPLVSYPLHAAPWTLAQFNFDEFPLVEEAGHHLSDPGFGDDFALDASNIVASPTLGGSGALGSGTTDTGRASYLKKRAVLGSAPYPAPVPWPDTTPFGFNGMTLEFFARIDNSAGITDGEIYVSCGFAANAVIDPGLGVAPTGGMQVWIGQGASSAYGSNIRASVVPSEIQEYGGTFPLPAGETARADDYFVTTYTMPDGEWVHYAAVVDGARFRLYVAGVKIQDRLIYNPRGLSDCGFYSIGALVRRNTVNVDDTADRFVDSLRFSAGARYSADFTPPTAQFTYP